MATTYDGSIRINTRIDTAGATTGIATITSGLKKMAATLGIAFSVEKIVEFTKASIEAASDLNEVQNVVNTTFGSMSSNINEFASTATEKFGLSTLAAKQYTGTMGAMLKSSGLTTSMAANMSTSIAGLAGDLASFYNLSTDEAFEKIRSGISGETMPLKQLGINLSEANLSAYALKQGMTTAYSSMSEQQKVLVRYNYLLSVTKDEQGDFVKTSNSWANQVRILKLNFEELEATLGKAFIATLTPVLKFVNQLISDLTYAASVFTDFIYTLTGTSAAANSTASAVSDLADATNDSTNATDDSTDATDKASDSLASFDKLNTLSSSSTSSGATGTTATPTTASTTGTTGTSGTTDNDLASKIKTSLNGIYALLITSSALLVIGAILTFSGHPLIGIGLMLAGAVGLAVAATLEWGSLNKTVKEQVSKMQALMGTALLVLGAIIAFSGANIPLGIALMIAGAANLAFAVAVNWNSMSTNVSNVLSTILGFVSSAFLVLGVILCFLGVNLPLGIALIVIGAASLVTAIAIDWNSTSNHIADTVSIIAGIIAGALLAIGAVMVFTGGSLPLGIALMVIGAATLASAIAINWNSLSSPMSGIISTITTIVGGAFLTLGAILCFSGCAIPLGIALMALGAVSLATAVAVTWNNMSTSLRTVITTVTAIVGTALLALGAILCFSGGALPLGIALMAIGAASLATTVALNWSTITNFLKTNITIITALVGTALLTLGAILAFSSVNIPLGIALMSVGAASLATTIALNWENITESLQGPVGEITALVGAAFLTLGAVLCFSGVGIPLGIALMAAGAVSLAAVIAVNWNSIVTALQGPIGLVTGLVGAALLALGAVLCFSGVGIPLGIGLMIAGGASLAAAIAPNWNAIPDKIKSVWTNIKDILNDYIITGVESFINFVISGFNKLINYLDKLNIKAPSWVTKLSGITSFGFSITPFSSISIPRLAQGAVIPPNRQFMAILGDQTSGTNIETPLSTMTDAFKSALSDMNISSSSSSPVNIIASADSAGLVKYFKFEIQKEDNRVGTQLVTGGGRY
jgi:hypothetical protein